MRFPVGEQTKIETRSHAESLGLRTAGKPDSQDICFVGKGDYRDFLREHSADVIKPGFVVDTDGERLASHNGVVDFTIGQRKGLGVALGEPRYVIDIEPGTATVTLGRKEDLATTQFSVHDVTCVSGSPPAPPGTAPRQARRPRLIRIAPSIVSHRRPESTASTRQTAER